MRSFSISADDASQRLDKFTEKVTVSLPRSLLYKYLRTKRIKLNGKKAEISTRLCEGDVVEMYIPEEFFDPESVPEAERLSRIKDGLSIVYEDGNVILTDKPAGVSCHPDEKQKTDTQIDRVKAYLYKNGSYDPEKAASFSPALCNRIDRNTSGIVICAKNAEALREMNELIRRRRVQKMYFALAKGKFDRASGVLKNYLIKDSAENRVAVYDSPRKGALTAVTEYRVVSYDGKTDRTELDILLHTGRTHQIRAQLAHIGHPLVGDGKYAENREDRKRGFAHQVLRAKAVAFAIPESEKADFPLLCYLDGMRFECKEEKEDNK